ncbi:hypothetical protein ACFVHW_00530 [Streptomyces sp. NPDC127110]|uniref:hypothetical protein n=1 Tax=Streptomyces sp. NPDC127110 TaxID=3345362 RepID=UPI00363EA1C4
MADEESAAPRREAAMPRQVCVDLFATLGCGLEAGFPAPMGSAATGVLVFAKEL